MYDDNDGEDEGDGDGDGDADGYTTTVTATTTMAMMVMVMVMPMGTTTVTATTTMVMMATSFSSAGDLHGIHVQCTRCTTACSAVHSSDNRSLNGLTSGGADSADTFANGGLASDGADSAGADSADAFANGFMRSLLPFHAAPQWLIQPTSRDMACPPHGCGDHQRIVASPRFRGRLFLVFGHHPCLSRTRPASI